ncbi:hypothetical protein C5142_11855 [Rhodococcus sp. BGS-1C]|uniref:Uncharacterized protein n=1 Tax=Rhodococcus cerastii TaxID=908616 RepID=A0ABU4D7G3_9NOCA|nr:MULTISPECIES: hypothetical protein [Rhodococcus]MDI9927065.1 hypothetical protein [Rhodococcus sp. IEGM 1341]MDV6305649.1 hypothetical protein [Rhodococcus cerastii]MDV7989070.1 hypothetical protein [Rhodococcus sp. IEGM 1374]MDV8056407.1 hypothetical protein [Rhodococcus sp. IEGM 1343]
MSAVGLVPTGIEITPPRAGAAQSSSIGSGVRCRAKITILGGYEAEASLEITKW